MAGAVAARHAQAITQHSKTAHRPRGIHMSPSTSETPEVGVPGRAAEDVVLPAREDRLMVAAASLVRHPATMMLLKVFSVLHTAAVAIVIHTVSRLTVCIAARIGYGATKGL